MQLKKVETLLIVSCIFDNACIPLKENAVGEKMRTFLYTVGFII